MFTSPPRLTVLLSKQIPTGPKTPLGYEPSVTVRLVVDQESRHAVQVYEYGRRTGWGDGWLYYYDDEAAARTGFALFQDPAEEPVGWRATDEGGHGRDAKGAWIS